MVEYDFILTLGPGRTRPICFEKIMEFVCWLRDICGFRFGKVTADTFQSQHMLQSLHAKGFLTDLQSVDRDKRAYLAWQAGFQEHNIRLYLQTQLLTEAGELIDTGSKIDHPPGGTKDTTDAAAGAYLNTITSEETLSLSVPQTPSFVGGISPHANCAPEDPFGFFFGVKSTPLRIFTNKPK